MVGGNFNDDADDDVVVVVVVVVADDTLDDNGGGGGTLMVSFIIIVAVVVLLFRLQSRYSLLVFLYECLKCHNQFDWKLECNFLYVAPSDSSDHMICNTVCDKVSFLGSSSLDVPAYTE